ncbi:hypothetical protein GCM10018952_76750 [Streptosporangium vulgare]
MRSSGRRGGLLPADAVQQQLGGRVVVEDVGEVDLLGEGVDGHGLRLGLRLRAPVGLARRVVGGALVVVAPLVVEVTVQVDAVGAGELAVAVVVAEVLAPEAVVPGEGVVVAVGVGDRDEPELDGVDQLGDLGVGAVTVQIVEQEPAGHLRGDPLTGVLGGHVEHGLARPVPELPRVLRHLDRGERLSLDRGAEVDDLGDVRLGVRRGDDLVADASGAAVRLEDAVPLGRLPARRRGPLDLQAEARLAELLRLGRAEDRLDGDLLAVRGLGEP